MISIRRISLGGGYRYLMESVAVGDGAAERSSSLSRYYASSGTPPGVFLGAGLADLGGDGGIAAGSEVTEEHLERMLAGCADPVTGESVGGTPKAPRGGVPVAGFDLTFSPPKSVSVAWALADEGTKAVIYECHLRAVAYVIGNAERTVIRSRSGANGIIEEDISGVVAAAFTHWTSRADDPQLHDHVVVWNRARSLSDGRWRTLDSRALFKATTTLSELHQGVLSDVLTSALGVGWEARGRRHSTRPRFEIDGVGERLMAEFSQRAEQIAAHRSDLTAAFIDAHGRLPTAVEQIHLAQRATLATRPAKSHATLAELTDGWRKRAVRHIGHEQVAWVAGLRSRNDLPLLRADDLGDPILADAAEAVLTAVSERHATFGRHNLLAEAHRTLHGVRFAGPDDRIAIAERICALAVDRSLSLTPPACITPRPAISVLTGHRGCGPKAASPTPLGPCWTPKPDCFPPAERPTARPSGSRRWQRSPKQACRAGTTGWASTRRWPSRRSPPPAGFSTCWSVPPGPARPRPWPDCEPHGRPTTGRVR